MTEIEDREHRSVTLSELGAGVRLRAGHGIVLVVSDWRGRRAASAPSPAAAPAGEHWVHHAFLSSKTGRAMAGVRWRLTKGEREIATGVTGADGRVSARVPEHDEYQLHVVDDPEPESGEIAQGAAEPMEAQNAG